MKTASSAKLEVHIVSHICQRRTEPQSPATCTKMVKFGHTVFELCERIDWETDRQTDILITILCNPMEAK